MTSDRLSSLIAAFSEPVRGLCVEAALPGAFWMPERTNTFGEECYEAQARLVRSRRETRRPRHGGDPMHWNYRDEPSITNPSGRSAREQDGQVMLDPSNDVENVRSDGEFDNIVM